jgi:hypothetical protein
MQWTPYMDNCVRSLEVAKETVLDHLLIAQAKCYVITNALSSSHYDDSGETETLNIPTPALITALLGQLADLRRSLPAQIRLDSMEDTQCLSSHSIKILIHS